MRCPDHRSFGHFHYRDRSQSYHPRTIPKYSIPRPDSAFNNPPRIGDVFYDTLICTAVHSVGVDPDMRKAILASIESDEALKAVESMIFQDPLTNTLVTTTRAVDIIGGGVIA